MATINGTSGDDNLVGTLDDDEINGLTGNDTMEGLAGADHFNGGPDSDTVVYALSPGAVTVDLASGTGTRNDAALDTYVGVENAIGSAFNDLLAGDAGTNVLSSGPGDDTLHGAAGADQLDGGNGSDFANFQGSGEAVTVDLLAGTASGGDAEGDVLTSIENLYGSSNDDSLTGSDIRNIIGGELGNDTIVGNGGDDSLSGEDGVDNLSGGDGNDRLIGGASADTILGGIGTDSVDAGSENDIVSGEAGDDSIVGGAGDDQIDGGIGNDIVEGAAGADTVTGGAGIDTAYYATSTGGVTVDLAAGTGTGGDAEGDALLGIEQLYGSTVADRLAGDAGNNTLWGNAGNDILVGGAGADFLKGGTGNDTFVYANVTESTVPVAGKDTIADFTAGDRIDLSAIDADGDASNGDTAFAFVGSLFVGQVAQVAVVAYDDGRQGVYIGIDGDDNPESIITVYAGHALTAADFVL